MGERKTVLLMFSGGLDSILSVVRLIKDGYNVKLINFDNSCTLVSGLVYDKALELEKHFGIDVIEYLGSTSTVALFRENELMTSNMSFRYILENYGDCTTSQIRCLNCRSAMYFEAIRYCLENDIKFIAEGARKSQLFAIEQPNMIDAYKSLLKEFGIELLLPVYDLEDDFAKENEIWRFGIVPAAGENKCLLGMPLKESLSLEQVDAVVNIFNKHIKPRYVRTLRKNNLPPQRIYKTREGVKFN